MAKHKSQDKPSSPTRQQQKRDAAHPNSLQNLRVGQGKGKSGGNGQMHHYRFSPAFAAALYETMRLNGDLPSGNIVDAKTTALLLESLKQECTSKFKAVYDMQSDNEWPNKLAKTTMSDQIRHMIMGRFDCNRLPNYVHTCIEALKSERPRWRDFWMQAIVVKHNHFVVRRAMHRGKASSVRLLNLLGNYTDAPDQPFPLDRFQQITIAAACPSDVLQSNEEEEEDDEEEGGDEGEGAPPVPPLASNIEKTVRRFR